MVYVCMIPHAGEPMFKCMTVYAPLLPKRCCRADWLFLLGTACEKIETKASFQVAKWGRKQRFDSVVCFKTLRFRFYFWLISSQRGVLALANPRQKTRSFAGRRSNDLGQSMGFFAHGFTMESMAPFSIYIDLHWLTGWWFGTFLFSHILGIIIPID